MERVEYPRVLGTICSEEIEELSVVVIFVVR